MPFRSPKHPRKRPRTMPQLVLQQTPQVIKLRRPSRYPGAASDAPDPISTPLLTPGDRPIPKLRTPQYTPLAQTPPVVPPTPIKTLTPVTPRVISPSNQVPVLDDLAHPSIQQSGSSGGLFSGHKSLTIESLHPTPPSPGTDVCPNLLRGHRDALDTRVRRLSFGADLGTPPGTVNNVSTREQPQPEARKSTLSQPNAQHSPHNTRRKRALRTRETGQELRVVENGDADTRKIPSKSGGELVRYECSQRDDYDYEDIPESINPFPDTPPDTSRTRDNECTPVNRPNLDTHNTPAQKPASLDMRTPEDTVVRRCRAPRWDGPITQIPETPIDQLPPREAPQYFVKTVVTAPGVLPSLPESLLSTPMLGSSSSGERRLGLLWMDIGRRTDSRDGERDNQGDDTRLGCESDSASTEPPSPVRIRNGEEVNYAQCRAQVFCRSVRVSIPAGGFRSPSPEPTPPHT